MLNKKFYFPLITLFFFSQLLTAQIHVDNNGSVGIGTETISSDRKFKLTFSGPATETSYYGMYAEVTNTLSTYTYGMLLDLANNSKRTYGCKIVGSYMGVSGSTDGSTNTTMTSRYGVYGKGNGSNNPFPVHYAIGVRGHATGGSVNYGIYGTTAEDATLTNGDWAGYFDGNVKILGDLIVTGNYPPISSDEDLKENIEPMEDVLEKIKKMKVKKYNYKQNKKIKFPNGKKYGFTAQDLEKIYPEMVTEVRFPYLESDDPESLGSDEFTEPEMISYKAIYYDQLIPTLIKGMQEQQEIIENQQATIEDLQKNQEEVLKRIELLEKK